MTKPTMHIDWMPDFSVDDEEPRKVIEPSDEKKLAGWKANERPPNQQWNWFYQLVGAWVRFFDKTRSLYDVTVGSGDDCTHATLAAAVADAGVGTNIKLLLRDNIDVDETINLTKAGWHIHARPGVTLTKDGAADGLSVEAAGIHITGLRFADFDTSGDNAIAMTAAATHCRILYCNFSACDTEVDDEDVPAGSKPVVLGNITE